MIPSQPICTMCKHFNKDSIIGLICKAYPEGIPEEIINGEHDHTKPFEGDNGIQFEPIEEIE